MPSDHTPHRRNYNEPGHAHELTFSCYRRYGFLRSERTCEWLSASIAKARAALEFDLWAYVFMSEHVHLVVFPRRDEYDIAEIRQCIKEPVARQAIKYLKAEAPEWLPRISLRKGSRTRHHFWQKGGGYDRNITEPNTLSRIIEYIHMNPVRRGLVERAKDWKWSSAAWFEGTGASPVILDQIPPEWTA